MKERWISSLLLALLCAAAAAAKPAIIGPADIYRPVRARGGMVVASEPLAAAAGADVLRQGGNAVDAAVTMGFVMAVTLPRAGNIGGGGFMLIHAPGMTAPTAIDYREKAPAAARQDMYVVDGAVDTELSRFSHRAAGVPGTVAGLALALEKHGTLSLADAVAPALKLASEGFPMPTSLAADIAKRAERLRRWPASRAVFFKADGSPYKTGDRFVQSDLARVLGRIAADGTAGFYRGSVAALIVADMRKHGGLINEADLAAYRPVVRQPVHGRYRDIDVYAMAPPSSGGVHLVQILNMLEGDDIGALGHNSAATIHLMAEAMKRAYADRARYLGDPDFVQVPIAGLTAKRYAGELRKTFSTTRATPSTEIAAGKPVAAESPQTTHFSVVDRHGNAVSNTYTLNFSFGSGIVVEGAGFLLNNEMDDFSAKDGSPNAYGLLGGAANAIAPGKRMLSSMSPTIALRDGKPWMVTGSPGGSRIITITLQILMNVIDHDMNIQEAVNASRIHHQWKPDQIYIENGISADTQNALKALGHTLKKSRTMGAAASILISEDGELHGASDPRRDGSAIGIE